MELIRTCEFVEPKTTITSFNEAVSQILVSCKISYRNTNYLNSYADKNNQVRSRHSMDIADMTAGQNRLARYHLHRR